MHNVLLNIKSMLLNQIFSFFLRRTYLYLSFNSIEPNKNHMSVFEITGVENLNKLIDVCAQNDKYLVIKASTEWCGPCKAVKSKYEKLANELVEKAVFTTFDVDEHEGIAEQFEISAMPTFIVVKGHDIITKVTGADLASVRASIE